MPWRVHRDDGWELVLSVLGAGSLVAWILGASWLGVPIVVGVAVLVAIALLLRRRMPWVALSATAVAIVIPGLVGAPAVGPWAAAQIVLFSLALHWPVSRSVWVAVGLAASLLALALTFSPEGSPGLPLGVVAWTFGIWGLATSIGAQRALVAALARRADELERDRDREIQRRLSAQRVQIARDLHDELAHNVAVIAVNAGAAEAALPAEADDSRAALQTVRSTARNVLAEVQGILGLLRDESASSREGVRPQLDDILRAAGELGLRTEVTGAWLPADAPATVHVTAMRILQESLINAHRHGANGTTAIVFSATDREWTMTVTNPVTRRPEPAGRTGFGVIGMTERAELIGARFRSQRSGEEWVVSLTVPTGQHFDANERA
ncbi:hypothetical protein KZX37_02120 [Microbacterium sp. EYE_5]|uniref:sensor histidine kinase n=1 Tax=unclassified Microbacterium TaxID=2609290 RepID=UPI002003B982|nr:MULTISPECIES: histidine kinase [unclassified Microbacterium]MCK6079413.1 hypothetical protein [Microbacterium sp. EYE_382]MCK6084683.1 hypothetical protein [Microbacterium sp. EYE_384]MCK6123088.1 hypothetical protein [Microbacterium sp. EYE_80]MCK6125447.1 hypothetical protein [Microbacterium sp. EYE_79]MCK6140367.1 hypothetical protein [Microbacterium sp. EYE_39]